MKIHLDTLRDLKKVLNFLSEEELDQEIILWVHDPDDDKPVNLQTPIGLYPSKFLGLKQELEEDQQYALAEGMKDSQLIFLLDYYNKEKAIVVEGDGGEGENDEFRL